MIPESAREQVAKEIAGATLPFRGGEWAYVDLDDRQDVIGQIERMLARCEDRRQFLEAATGKRVTVYPKIKLTNKAGRPAVQVDCEFRESSADEGFYPAGTAEFVTFADVRKEAGTDSDRVTV